MDFVRMNYFQRLTREWNDLHPYVAAQVMRIGTPVSPQGLSTAWQAMLVTLGLGRVEIRGHRYRHLPEALPLQMLPAGCDLESLISREMNRGFDLLREGPFRAYARRDGETWLLAIVYDHWLADSVSIRLLMREWFFRLAGAEVRNRPLATLEQATEQDGRVELPFSLASLDEWREHGRHVRRLPEAATRDQSVSHRLLRLDDTSAAELRHAARRRGVKVSDLLLCSIARVCDRHIPALNPRRPDLALGNVRDLRTARRQDDPDAFGCMLSMATLICPHQKLADRGLLLSHIAEQNRLAREPESICARNVDRRVSLAAHLLLSGRRLAEFCARRMPLAAGLSNVNLSATWVAHYSDHIIEYYRVSPTGPLLPLVITPTTLEDHVNISLTWRNSVFSREAIEAVSADLVAEMRAWTASAGKVAYEPAA